jgi:hypothetical protein
MKRSKEGALSVLLQTRDEVIEEMTDSRAASILDNDLIAAVLELAWQYQFEEDRSVFRNELQKLLSDSIEKHFLQEAKN